MEESGSPKILFESLDLTPIHPILWTGLHGEGPGRPVEYQPEWDLRALMLRQLLQIPYVKDLVKRLGREPYLRRICGYGDRVPTEAHFTQMKRRIGEEGFRIIEAWLRHQALSLRSSQPLAAVGLIQAACIDGTDLRAWSSRDMNDNQKGLGDPDARLGRGKRGFYLGYRSLFLVDIEGLPLGHVESPANVNEKMMVEPLLDMVLGEDLEVELIAADSQLDSQAVFDSLESRKVNHIIARRRMRGRENPSDALTVKDRIGVEGPEWMCTVYKLLRSKAESIMGRVKSRLGFERLTWQGLGNVSIHVSLVLSVVYAAAIAAARIERPEKRQSIAYFA
ncbi:MAG: transposase [Candidatus Bathyarchaeota archaeon]|nr:transposase [Candidatus Bathyarchaeota archaeon]